MSTGPIYRLTVRFVAGATLSLGEFHYHQTALDVIETFVAYTVAEHLALRTGLTFDSQVRSPDNVQVTCTDPRKQFNPTGLHCIFTITKVYSGTEETDSEASV